MSTSPDNFHQSTLSLKDRKELLAKTVVSPEIIAKFDKKCPPELLPLNPAYDLKARLASGNLPKATSVERYEELLKELSKNQD